jgi:uncharacterized protein
LSEREFDDELAVKIERLRAVVRDYGSALVAYSGGVDSALVMAVAHEELGERALACIGVSPSYPAREMRAAIGLAEERSWPYRLVATDELHDASYAANAADRCYFCKSELHTHLQAIAKAEGWRTVVDGNNASDLGDIRPGMAAARERGVRSPLIEAGIAKTEVREIAQALGLPVWNKPAMACLSSRIPQDVPITLALLRQIEAAEDVLAGLGFQQFRVRHHGDIARIELPVKDLPLAMEQRQAIVEGIAGAGYRFAALDLAGFRSGSLSAASQGNGHHMTPIALLDSI